MEEKLLNVLFDKKVEEFMEYQKHIISRIKELRKELFTKEVVDALLQYQDANSRVFATDNLWLKAISGNYAYAETNPNKSGHASSHLGIQEIAYCKPRNIKELKGAINGFKAYENLLYLMEIELPKMIEDLFEWKKKYITNEIEYLNNLDFSVSKKAKHYVITIKVEEVEE